MGHEADYPIYADFSDTLLSCCSRLTRCASLRRGCAGAWRHDRRPQLVELRVGITACFGRPRGGGTSVASMSGRRHKPFVALAHRKELRDGLALWRAGRYQACNERPDEGRSHHAFRPARTRIGRWAMNTAPPELREIVKARHPQQRAATGDDTAADMVRGRSVGCERRSARSGRARTRKGRARGAAGDSIGNGTR